jgi:hypothetical protein
MTLAGSGIGLTVSGSLTFQATNFSRTYTGTTTFNATTTGKTVTTNGVAFNGTVNFNGVGGGWTLGSAFTNGGGQSTQLTNGTLDLSSYTLSTGLFSSSNSNTRTIAFGTGQITVSGTSATIWNTPTVTGLTTTGTQVVNITNATSTSRTILSGSLSEANSISFNISGALGTVTILGTASETVRNLDFTGFGGTLSTTSTGTIYGNLKLVSGMTLTVSGSAMTFGATSGTQQITTNTKTIDFPLTFNGIGGTFQLQDALTMGSTRTATLTNGTLNLQSFTLSTGLFSSSNSNTRTIAFGTGNIECTGTGTVWTTATVTGLTTTGTQVVNVTSTGSTAITVSTGALSEANSISYNFTGGTYALTFLNVTNQTAKGIDFTGFAGTLGAIASCTVYGNIKFSTGMTLTASNSQMGIAASSGIQQITTNAKTIDFPLGFGNGAIKQLQDALTMGSTRPFTLGSGTVDLNGKTLTVGSSFTTSAGTKDLTFNGGTLVCPTNGTTAFNNAVPTGFTTTAGTGTGTISMTAATAKTFVGGGSTFNCTLQNAGAGALTITGSNTFTSISNSVQPTTFTFTASTTTTVTNWNVNGTAGNLVTIGSATAASHTLSKASGTVSSDYLSISRSTATGGASWYAGANSTNGGNNSGWIFTAPPSVTATGNFLVFF